MPDRIDAPAEPSRPDRGLLLFLRFIGGVTLLAFGAAVMPSQWIVEAAEWLGFDPFPDSPLTYYLARNLSLLYGFVGVSLLVIAADLDRYRPLVRVAWIGVLAFGTLQLIVDWMSGLPLWWTLGEGLSTVVGGFLLAWLDHRTPASVTATAHPSSRPS